MEVTANTRSKEFAALVRGVDRSRGCLPASIIRAPMPGADRAIRLGPGDQPEEPATVCRIAAPDHQRRQLEAGGGRHDRRGRIAAPDAELGLDDECSRLVPGILAIVAAACSNRPLVAS